MDETIDVVETEVVSEEPTLEVEEMAEADVEEVEDTGEVLEVAEELVDEPVVEEEVII